jgi:hypothetical protein
MTGQPNTETLNLYTSVIAIGIVDREEGTRLHLYLALFMWTEIGFSANHQSSGLGARCKGCCDWLIPPELSRGSEPLEDMDSGIFSLTLSM